MKVSCSFALGSSNGPHTERKIDIEIFYIYNIKEFYKNRTFILASTYLPNQIASLKSQLSDFAQVHVQSALHLPFPFPPFVLRVK